jgi:acyl dehydratase
VSGSPRPTVAWADLKVGDELPPLVVDMTATRVVAGAIATRDFMPVHHDRSYANAQGAPEIFMNIFSDLAYVSRFVTDWAGPDAVLTKVAIRLGVPAFAGCTLTFTGRVTGLSANAAQGLVDIELRATNDLGDHVTGTVVVDLPIPGAGS